MSETYGNDSSVVLLLVLRANECWRVRVSERACCINIIMKQAISDSKPYSFFNANIHYYLVLS